MQYVMANIKIPIRINSTGETSPLMEYIAIAIEKCDSLPAKSVDNLKELSMVDLINSALFDVEFHKEDVMASPEPESVEKDEGATPASSPEFPPLFVSKEEVETKSHAKSRQNTTFKQKHRKISRYSMKNYARNSSS
jgi:hypothetical protein